MATTGSGLCYMGRGIFESVQFRRGGIGLLVTFMFESCFFLFSGRIKGVGTMDHGVCYLVKSEADDSKVRFHRCWKIGGIRTYF